MILHKEKIFLLFALCFQIACSAPDRAAIDQSEIKMTPDIVDNTKRRAEETITRKPVERQDFFGCWSTGNGMVLKISKDQIFLSTNHFKPVRYTEEKFENGVLVIKLLDRPQFYYLSEIVSFEFDKDADWEQDFPLVHRSFQSLNDFEKGDSDGENAWVRSDCSLWFNDPSKPKN
jgi:hypothetical protein